MLSVVLLVVTIHVASLTLYVAPFIPIVTAAAVKLKAPAWLKVGITAGLAAAVAIVTTAISQSTDLILVWSMLWKILLSFGVAMGSYLVLRVPIVQPLAVHPAIKDKGIG